MIFFRKMKDPYVGIEQKPHCLVQQRNVLQRERERGMHAALLNIPCAISREVNNGGKKNPGG